MTRFAAILAVSALAACATERRARDPLPGPSITGLRVPYYCERGPGLAVTFASDRATIERTGFPPLVLNQRVAASGFWYHRPAYEFRGKGYEAFWSVGTLEPVRCQAYRPHKSFGR